MIGSHYCQCGTEIEQGHPCPECHPTCRHGHVDGVGCRACDEARGSAQLAADLASGGGPTIQEQQDAARRLK